MKSPAGSLPAEALERLLREVRGCTICADYLPQVPRPVLKAGSKARILIASQAPGRKVDRSGIPFDDPSGDRLREWMGIGTDVFYDPNTIAILPLGFCYPPARDAPATCRQDRSAPRPGVPGCWNTCRIFS